MDWERSWGEDWADHVDRGPALVEDFANWLVTRHRGGRIASYHRAMEPWLACVRHFEAYDAAVALAPMLAEPAGGPYLDRLGEPAVPVLIEFLQKGWFVRTQEMGDDFWSFDETLALRWLADNHAEAARQLFVGALQSKRVPMRRAARDGLVAAGDRQALAEGLRARRKDVRLAAIEGLIALGVPESRPAIEQALDKEKVGALRELLQQALGVSVDHDPTRYPDDAELDAALGAIGEEPVEGLPLLRWRSGREVSAEAFGWLVARLREESLSHHDPQLVAIGKRLEPASAHLVCGALQRRFSGPYVVAALGGPEQIDMLGGLLPSLASSQIDGYGGPGVETLRRNGSARAVGWLRHLRDHSGRDGLTWRCRDALLVLANDRGVSEPELPGDSIEAGSDPLEGVHPTLRDSLTAVDASLWPPLPSRPIPVVRGMGPIQIALWCVAKARPYVAAKELATFDAIVVEAQRVVAGERPDFPAAAYKRGKKTAFAVAPLLASACTVRPDMRFMSVRSIAARVARLLGEDDVTEYLAGLAHELELAELRAATAKYAPNAEVARVLFRADRGNGTAGHFLWQEDDGSYGLITKMKGRWRSFSGDRDSMLATLPDSLFAAGSAALSS